MFVSVVYLRGCKHVVCVAKLAHEMILHCMLSTHQETNASQCFYLFWRTHEL